MKKITIELSYLDDKADMDLEIVKAALEGLGIEVSIPEEKEEHSENEGLDINSIIVWSALF
ncbi:MAG: hypothetical protein WBP54_11255 [Pelodictyon phaeoclathratiforme]